MINKESNLRILIYSNPLVVDKIAKRFLFWKDSGFIFTKNMIKTLPTAFRYYWLIPDTIKEQDRDWFYSANTNVELIDYPYSTSIHQNRYEFYGKVLRAAFPYSKDVDVILNNQPEIAANLRVWAYNQRRDLPIIYSFFHWIDCAPSRKFSPELGGYFWREYDGALNSDAIYLHKGYAVNLWKDEVKYRGVLDDNIVVREFTPSYTIFGTIPFELPKNKKIILFNHRLNNTTNWKEVLDICKSLYEIRKDFVLWITDENGSMKESELKQYPFVILKHIPDEHYGYLIQSSHIAICNHKGYSTWNMAVLDSICNGCFTLVPNDSVYLQMFNDSMIWIHKYTDLRERIELALDIPIESLRFMNKAVQEYVFNSLLIPTSTIENNIYTDINKKLGSTPKKYEEVTNYISPRSKVTKKEWVNRFWTFHTNSNFQRIRWHLLSDGFLDDTSNSETIYIKR